MNRAVVYNAEADRCIAIRHSAVRPCHELRDPVGDGRFQHVLGRGLRCVTDKRAQQHCRDETTCQKAKSLPEIHLSRARQDDSVLEAPPKFDVSLGLDLHGYQIVEFGDELQMRPGSEVTTNGRYLERV